MKKKIEKKNQLPKEKMERYRLKENREKELENRYAVWRGET